MADYHPIYRNLNPYLKEKYGCRVFKICLDGGFTCPNRDGTAGFGGCIFCGERGAGEHLRAGDITSQMCAYFARKRKAEKFIAYFQNFSGTYAPIPVLKEKYDAALAFESVCVLSVATRADCISEEVCALLASYLPRADVWVEIGLQTANDEIAAFCNRGYSSSLVQKAVKMLQKYHLNVILHVMIGLPGETEKDVLDTAAFVNDLKPFGVKVHSTYVLKGTRLEELYLQGEYTPLSLEEYCSRAALFLKSLSPEILVHKVTGDAPKSDLVAPLWNLEKNAILNGLKDALSRK